jgi:acyl-CoA synthetase (NDP forming)
LPSAPRDLESFFDPRSIAIVGASSDPGKWGYWLARSALHGADRRDVHLVNRSSDEVLGHRAHRSLEELPADPELVVLAVPARSFDSALDGSLRRGARALIGITAGFAEASADGARHQQEVVRRVREAGAALIGPNCLGLMDTATGLQVAWMDTSTDVPPGPVGIVAQSGSVALDLCADLPRAGIGVSRFATLGNQADVTAADLVRTLTEHEPTRLIALYCEDFVDGRAFLHAAQAARDAGKHVVLLAAGGDAASARAAAAHTGSVSTADAIVDAACRETGAIRVATTTELVDTAQMLLRIKRPRGRRLGVVTDGGGPGVIAAGAAARAGYELPAFSDELAARLTDATDPSAATRNPVDIAIAGTDPRAFARTITAIAESGEVDAVVMVGYFGNWDGLDEKQAALERDVAATIARVAGAADLPLIVHTSRPDSKAIGILRDAGAPVYTDIERALGALRRTMEAAPRAEEPRSEAVAAEPGVHIHVRFDRDVRFGPVLSLRTGGVIGALLDDTTFTFAPASQEAVRDALERLAAVKASQADSMGSALDLDAVSATVARFSADFAQDSSPDRLAFVVRADVDGVWVVDSGVEPEMITDRTGAE